MTQKRTLVTGSVELVWARATDRLNSDLSGINPELRTVFGGSATSWVAPEEILRPSDNVIRAALLVTAGAVGTYKVQMKVVDSPETVILDCGFFEVIPL